MIREIRLPRTTVSSVHDALRWSDDGQLALVSGTSVTILSPSVTKSLETSDEHKVDEQYDTTNTISIDEKVYFLDGKVLDNDEELSIGGTSSEHVITDVRWSPSGISIWRGCLLAALTTRNELFIYESTGNPGVGKWVQRVDMNRLLLSDLHLDSYGLDDESSPPLKDAYIRSIRFHSMSWTKACPTKLSKWGTSFLLLGTEDGGVIIYSVDPETGVVFKSRTQLYEQTDWITGIETSEWWSESGTNNAWVTVTNSTNEVKVAKLCYDVTAESVYWGAEGIYSILGPSRFYISVQNWYLDRANNAAFLAVCRTGTLDIWRFEQQQQPQHQRVFTGFSSIGSGVVLFEDSDNDSNNLRVTVTSCKGETFCCEVKGSDPMILTAMPEQVISGLVSRKRKTLDIATSDSNSNGEALVDFRIYAAVLHPHGSFMAVVYAIFQGKKLRYPINSEQSRRIAFLPLTASPSPSLMPSAWPITAGSSLCTWWEIRALTKALPPMAREEYKKTLIKNISREIESDPEIVNRNINNRESTGDLSQDLYMALINDSTMDKLRLLAHYGERPSWDSLVIKILAITTLKFINHRFPNEGDISNPIDRAILYSLSQQLNDEETATDKLKFTPSTPELITISGGFFDQQFLFPPDVTNSTAIENHSESGTGKMKWKKCSITLLPIMSVDCLTCTGCFKKALKTKSSELVGSVIGTILLHTLDACIYCGGRYYERSE